MHRAHCRVLGRFYPSLYCIIISILLQWGLHLRREKSKTSLEWRLWTFGAFRPGRSAMHVLSRTASAIKDQKGKYHTSSTVLNLCSLLGRGEPRPEDLNSVPSLSDHAYHYHNQVVNYPVLAIAARDYDQSSTPEFIV